MELLPMARPRGRLIADIGKLSHGEQRLLDAANIRKICCVGCERPESSNERNKIRGEFLRFLLLGGDDANPVHENGVALQGAFIDADINLDHAENVCPLRLVNCHIEGRLSAKNATLRRIDLSGSSIDGIDCDGAEINGSVILQKTKVQNNGVRFYGAKISSDLTCSGAEFSHKHGQKMEKRALFISLANITGKVSLNERFVANGEVRGVDAEIGGHLDCRNAQFNNPGAKACAFDGAKIAGAVFLSDDFKSNGSVEFPRAKIGGKFYCLCGKFEVVSGKALTCNGAQFSSDVCLSGCFNATGEVDFSGAHIAGKLEFKNIRAVKSINFSGAHAHIIEDSIDAWPKGATVLDGFTYDRFDRNALTDAATRKNWLRSQANDDDGLSKDFRPQPYEQLIKVLRATGHDREANKIAIFKEERRLRQPWGDKCSWWRNPINWFRYIFLEQFIGYGYRRRCAVGWTAFVWIVMSILFCTAAQKNMFAPTNPIVFLNEDLRQKCGKNWTECTDPRMKNEHTPFIAWAYALDVLLPIVPLGQEAAWAPMGKCNFCFEYPAPIWKAWKQTFISIPSWPTALVWLGTLFGWIFGLIIAASVSGIIRRD